MNALLRLSTGLLLVATAAACNRTEPAPSADAAPAAAGTAAPATPADAAPAAAQPTAVTLTMDNVRAWVKAQKNLATAAQADASLGDPAINISEEDTPKYAARLAASAKMRAAIEDAGLSTAEFASIGETLVSAMMAQAAVDAGQLKAVPDGIDPAAVEFVREHQAELQALMTAGAG